jgi:hypothetical protein
MTTTTTTTVTKTITPLPARRSKRVIGVCQVCPSRLLQSHPPRSPRPPNLPARNVLPGRPARLVARPVARLVAKPVCPRSQSRARLVENRARLVAKPDTVHPSPCRARLVESTARLVAKPDTVHPSPSRARLVENRDTPRRRPCRASLEKAAAVAATRTRRIVI